MELATKVMVTLGIFIGLFSLALVFMAVAKSGGEFVDSAFSEFIVKIFFVLFTLFLVSVFYCIWTY